MQNPWLRAEVCPIAFNITFAGNPTDYVAGAALRAQTHDRADGAEGGAEDGDQDEDAMQE